MPQEEATTARRNVKDTGVTNQPVGLFVSRLQVEKLFGQYDYDLRPSLDYDDTSKLLIFYGENGSGKTTLLWLIHHMLSKTGSGHKSFVARTKFKTLSIWLGKEIVVSAIRDEAADGSFLMAIKDGRVLSELFLPVDEDGDIRMKNQQEEFQAFIAKLPDLNLPFLRDTRRMAALDDEDENDPDIRSQRELRLRVAGQTVRDEPRNQTAPERALRRLSRWVAQEAILGSEEGQLNVNSVYGEIIRRIALPAPRKKEADKPKPEELIASLREQSLRTKRFSEYGLTSDLNVDSFVESIERNKGSKQRLQIIEQILRPFLEGNTARLDALQQIQTTINNFVASVNSFYRNKRLEFHLRTGARVLTEDGRRISVRKLSSGEQELLLLFCDVLVTKKTPTIFIIDEPELSLNITWQRTLIGALLKLAGNSPIQFLLATHSIELLAQRRKAVLRLSIEESNGDEQ